MKTVILSFCVIMALSACSNTMDGAGRDIEKMGKNIQKTF